MPDREQQVLASILEEELADEVAWSRRLAGSPKVLEMLVNSAKRQYEAGVCTEEEIT